MTIEVKKKPGRPKISDKKEIVGTAIEPDLVNWIEKECQKLGFSRSSYIRKLILTEREKTEV